MTNVQMLRIIICSALLLSAFPASAQTTYPTRTVTLVVVTGPGGGTDITSRELAERLTRKLGKSFVVENRPGANGVTAAEYVARAPADGYVLLMGGNATHSANPYLFRSIKYDPVRDFVPISRLATAGAVVVVSPGSGLHSMADLLREAKIAPGRYSYGAPNPGAQIVGERIKQMAAVDILRVPYRSTPQALSDVIAGNVTMAVVDVAAALGNMTSGRIRALAITSARRSTLVPEVPTLQEAGFKDFDLSYWNGIFAPAGTPSDVIATLDHAVGELMGENELIERFKSVGLEPAYLPHDQMEPFVRFELAHWGELVRQAGIEPN
jgi:tripartite-type tricarboxylate transporter receptor subunit TctC